MTRLSKVILAHVVFLVAMVAVVWAGTALAADVDFAWDSASGATGYMVQISTDQGQSWGEKRDAGAATSYTWADCPEDALVLFRAISYNAHGEAIRTEAGAWYCHGWRPPATAPGLGID